MNPWDFVLFPLAVLSPFILFFSMMAGIACWATKVERRYDEVGWDKCPKPDPWEGVNERPGWPG